MHYSLQSCLKSYTDEMGKYSAVGTISFKTSDGTWEPRTVGYIATVRQLLMDLIHTKGYKRPGIVVSMDSGAGKFLVTAKVYDRDNLSGMNFLDKAESYQQFPSVGLYDNIFHF